MLLPEGMNLNQELVKQGWCWWYQKYAPGDTVLEHLEREVGEARTGGLWADPKPVPPREGRKRSRHCSPMAEFSGFVAELSKVRAEPH